MATIMDILIAIPCTIGGIILIAIVIACLCRRGKGQKGMVLDATGQSGGHLAWSPGPQAGVPVQQIAPPDLQTRRPQPSPGSARPAPSTSHPTFTNSADVSSAEYSEIPLGTDIYTQLDPSLMNERYPHSSATGTSVTTDAVNTKCTSASSVPTNPRVNGETPGQPIPSYLEFGSNAQLVSEQRPYYLTTVADEPPPYSPIDPNVAPARDSYLVPVASHTTPIDANTTAVTVDNGRATQRSDSDERTTIETTSYDEAISTHSRRQNADAGYLRQPRGHVTVAQPDRTVAGESNSGDYDYVQNV